MVKGKGYNYLAKEKGKSVGKGGGGGKTGGFNKGGGKGKGGKGKGRSERGVPRNLSLVTRRAGAATRTTTWSAFFACHAKFVESGMHSTPITQVMEGVLVLGGRTGATDHMGRGEGNGAAASVALESDFFQKFPMSQHNRVWRCVVAIKGFQSVPW